MDLSAKEQQEVQEWVKEGRSWRGWTWMFFGVGGISVMAAALSLGAISLLVISRASDFSLKEQTEAAKGALLFLVLGLYFVGAGINERRQRRRSELLTKLVNLGRAKD
jgi:hypothetical protein